MEEQKKKRVRDAKIGACTITQQFDINYWKADKWQGEDAELLEQVRHGQRGIGDLLNRIVQMLESAGMSVSEAYGIRHDRDVQESWDDDKKQMVVTQKANHGHMVIRFETKKGGTVKEIAEAVGLESQYIEKMKQGKYSYDNALSYLIHVKYPDKYQYDASDVATAKGTDYKDICAKRYEEWKKGRGTLAKVAARLDIDDLEYRILNGEVTKSQVLLTDDLYTVYSRYKRRCDDAFACYAERKVYKAIQKLDSGEFAVTVFFVTGPAGSGKTAIVTAGLVKETKRRMKEAGEDWADYYAGATNGFDAYMGEEIVVLDDLRGSSMRAEDWLRLMDPHRINQSSARYSNKTVAARVIIITSTYDPVAYFESCRDMGGEPISQFIRRIQSRVRIVRPQNLHAETIEELRERTHLSIANTGIKENGTYEFLEDVDYTFYDGMENLVSKIMANNKLLDGGKDDGKGKAET